METQHDIAPHKCPACGYNAYVGMNEVECVNVFCKNFHNETAARWDAAAPKKLDTGQVGIPMPEKYKDMLRPISQDEDDTEPQLNLDDLDAKLEHAMRPFGECTVERLEYEDRMRVVLYNKPTNVYVQETFDVSLLSCMDDPSDWLIERVLYSFPRELAQSWKGMAFMGEFENQVGRMSVSTRDNVTDDSWLRRREYTYQSTPKAVSCLRIGQRIGEWRVVGMDRSAGSYTVRAS